MHGRKEGSACNGHYESVRYHPLPLFNRHGDCLAAKLRPGNVSGAEDWNELLLSEIERQQAEGKRVAFRADAAFAQTEICEALEERGVGYVIRITDYGEQEPGAGGRRPSVPVAGMAKTEIPAQGSPREGTSRLRNIYVSQRRQSHAKDTHEKR